MSVKNSWALMLQFTTCFFLLPFIWTKGCFCMLLWSVYEYVRTRVRQCRQILRDFQGRHLEREVREQFYQGGTIKPVVRVVCVCVQKKGSFCYIFLRTIYDEVMKRQTMKWTGFIPINAMQSVHLRSNWLWLSSRTTYTPYDTLREDNFRTI